MQRMLLNICCCTFECKDVVDIRRIGMKRLVEFPLDAGSTIVVEVNEPETGGTVRASRGDKIERAKETLEAALDHVLPATKHIVDKLRTVTGHPDEIEVSFGVNLGSEAGAFIASASVEANFSVTIRWHGPEKHS
jgi:hypothetical protein